MKRCRLCVVIVRFGIVFVLVASRSKLPIREKSCGTDEKVCISITEESISVSSRASKRRLSLFELTEELRLKTVFYILFVMHVA